MPTLRSTAVFSASSSDRRSARGLLRSRSVSAVTGAVTGAVVEATFGVGVVGVVAGLVCAARLIAPNAQIAANNRLTAVMQPSWTRIYYVTAGIEFLEGHQGPVHSNGT